MNIVRHHELTQEQITFFEEYLRTEEREEATVKKYVHYTRDFFRWLDGASVTKAAVAWKEALQKDENLAPATVNAKIASINAFFKYAGWKECKVKALRLQRRVFRDAGLELTKEEYQRLIEATNLAGNERLALIMETICSTGIRVSEVKYITAETIENGRTVISLKRKIRTILLPGELCRKLKKYIRKKKIASGEIFLTRSGKGVSRRQIWAEIKSICKAGGHFRTLQHSDNPNLPDLQRHRAREAVRPLRSCFLGSVHIRASTIRAK